MNRERAHQAVDEAARAINEADQHGDQAIPIRIAADTEGTRILDDEPAAYCPGRLPCFGRPGVRIAVPVRIVASEDPARRIGEQVGEVTATYCPICRSMKADEREPQQVTA